VKPRLGNAIIEGGKTQQNMLLIRTLPPGVKIFILVGESLV
jgi:hypothetical protein